METWIFSRILLQQIFKNPQWKQNWRALSALLWFVWFLFSLIRYAGKEFDFAFVGFVPLSDSEHPDRILATGMERFIVTDLKLNPASRLVLILAWKFGARTQGEFTKDEFLHGMHALEYVPSWLFFSHHLRHT